MTAHSEHGGIILFPTSDTLADEFVDTAKVRDWYFNSLLHLYDGIPQVKVSMSVPNNVTGDQPGTFSTDIQLVRRDVFPVMLRSNVTPPPIIVRFSTAITNTASAKWWLYLNRPQFTGPPTTPSDESDDRIDTSTHAIGTDGAQKGHGPFTLTIDALDVVEEGYDSELTRSGSEFDTVILWWAELSIWVERTAGEGSTDLRSLSVREYIGDE